MGTNEFVGPEEDFHGLANASWGTLAVILKNGAPERVITPGTRFGRGWRAPLLGRLTAVQLNTDTVPFVLRANAIPTSDDFHVSLVINALVRLNPASDYSYLTEFVRAQGRNFAEALIQEVERGLTKWAFAIVGRQAHAELRRRSMNEVFSEVTLPVAFDSGVLLVTSFTLGACEWDAHALAIEDAQKKANVRIAEATATQVSLSAESEAERAVGLAGIATQRVLDSARAQAEAQLQLERVAVFTQVAEITGLPLAQLAFPEQYALTQERAHQAAMALLTPEMRVMWQRNPEIVEGLFAQAGIGMQVTPGPAKAEQPAAARELGRATVETADAGVGPETDLNVDVTLKRVWLRHRGDVPLGIGGAAGDPASVVVVTSDRTPVTDALKADLARVYAGASVRVRVLDSTSVGALIDDWLRQVWPNHELTCSLAPDDEDLLVVGVNGPALEVAAAVRTLNAPSESDLAALTDLLPYLGIRLTIGHA